MIDLNALHMKRPNLEPSVWTGVQNEAVGTIAATLVSMVEFVRCFSHAVLLLDHCDELNRPLDAQAAGLRGFSNIAAMRAIGDRQSIVSSWMYIAARDAVMTVWHVRDCLRHLEEAMIRANELSTIADANQLRLIIVEFNRRFGRAEDMRNAVGHWAEVHANPNRNATRKPLDLKVGDTPAIRGGGGGGMIALNVLLGRRFTVTHEGKPRSLDIDQGSLDRLVEVVELTFDVFRPAEGATMARWKAEQEAKRARASPRAGG